MAEPIRVKQEPRDEDDLDALFAESDDEEMAAANHPLKREVLTAEQKAEEEARRRRALQRQRATHMRSKKRLVCDCYTDQATKRARVHVKAVEETARELKAILPVPAEMHGKGVNERINQTRVRLRKVEKLARQLKDELQEIRRAADNGVARGNMLAMKIACVVAKRSDINVVSRNGKSLKVTPYDDFESLTYRPKPRGRRQ